MSDPLPTAIVIEDEPQIRRFVRAALEGEGWSVVEADTVRRGLIDIGTRRPDLVIVDLGLPDGDGAELIRDVRNWSSVPVIVLSARADETDKVKALDAGADDYLVKPFGVAELMARVRANLRRSRNDRTGSPVFTFGNVQVDQGARIVRKAGAEVHLTPIEYRLLGVLIANVGRVMTHQQLLRAVWGPGRSDSSHYLRVYMGHLRQKLEDDAAQPRHILTETAVGYRLVEDAAGH
ncbi:two-component system response regulator KdpE [Pigmentiphaga litoralis]|uniref:two-component system response regulator KdpE n=1 Tax=Pigmentiphaga litoralis TaxID=516702 RepID=UPI003B42A91F